MTVIAPTVTLRPAGPADEPFLLAVYASTRADELTLVEWSDAEKDAFVLQQFTAQTAHYREYENATFDVIEVDGEPAGRLYVARWEHELRIMDVALLPERRGAGVATLLLGELLAEAAEAGKKVSIHVEVGNPARRLYERLGFAPVEERGVYVLMEATPA
jgi:ribosomal protein S18 acetylase RimI-like enzyme